MAQVNNNRSDEYSLVPEERRRRIAQIIQEAGSVTVPVLEAEFGISPATARRDLTVLERAGQAKRTHGGAIMLGVAAHEDSFEHRLEEAVAAKKQLAESSLKLMGPDETVFVDSSTTAYYAVQRILAEAQNGTVVTNLLPVMELFKTMDASNNIALIGIGGAFKILTKSFVGPSAVQIARMYFADKAFLSAKGLTTDGYLTDPDPLEAEVKRTMIERSENPVLLLDGRKFERQGMSVIAHVSQVSLVIVADVGVAHVEALSKMGVKVEQI